MQTDIKQAFLKASNYCSKREACIFDIKKKLYQWQIPENLYSEIIDLLIKQNYINENRYAEAFVNDKYKFNHWGRLKIKHALLSINIDNKYISKALQNINETEYYTFAQKSICQKAKTLNFDDYIKSKQKLIRYILGKGYEPELVQKITDECINKILRKKEG